MCAASGHAHPSHRHSEREESSRSNFFFLVANGERKQIIASQRSLDSARGLAALGVTLLDSAPAQIPVPCRCGFSGINRFRHPMKRASSVISTGAERRRSEPQWRDRREAICLVPGTGSAGTTLVTATGSMRMTSPGRRSRPCAPGRCLPDAPARRHAGSDSRRPRDRAP
jgi:hypothetical protein